MPVDPHSLARFTAHRADIVAADPLRQPAMAHDPARWLAAGLPGFNTCLDFLGGLSITRQDIFNAVAQNLAPQARFLMQMIWGYAPPSGYAPSRVADYFQSPVVNNPAAYEKVIDAIRAGDLKGAYTQLCGVKGLNTSYITKVLYFESRHLPAKIVPRYALILDDKVSAGLVKITSPWVGECVATSAPRPEFDKGMGERARNNRINRAWARYWAYVEGCHDIAAALDTNADNVEYFLFNE